MPVTSAALPPSPPMPARRRSLPPAATPTATDWRAAATVSSTVPFHHRHGPSPVAPRSTGLPGPETRRRQDRRRGPRCLKRHLAAVVHRAMLRDLSEQATRPISPNQPPLDESGAPTKPPSSAWSAPSWPTPTTNGSPTNAATSPKDPWRCWHPRAIIKPSPPSPAATSRHQAITSKAHHPAGHYRHTTTVGHERPPWPPTR